ncbi:aminoglycoside phosphotransferase family protein [Magnetospira sp. QH-2]|uniref:aminoglycoside phosphotransferase family protein n=1 Tax=Magnetospira sp. (strain QH-2) TaxID=1288970 RepID=UPI0003E80E1F|nr:aminoglycoside phosphotransferase family protein [Magnetospira sp. QH-2]CCQ72147.1 conserved protein of unknown function [Magnetospira sp. QH-2]
MQAPIPIDENLRFLIIEVRSHATELKSFFESGAQTPTTQMMDRNHYIYSIKARIHGMCLEVFQSRKKNILDGRSFWALGAVATALARISDLCCDCVRHARRARKSGHCRCSDLAAMMREVLHGIALIETAEGRFDLELAMEVCGTQPRLARDHKRLVNRLIKRKKSNTVIIDNLYIAQKIEEMGESLLTIGEAVISANLGLDLDIDRYQTLRSSLEKMHNGAQATIETLAETRSGSGVSGISDPDNDDDQIIAVLKDGKKRKLKAERQKVEVWNGVFPGLAPKILSYRKHGDRAGLLIQHLPGLTFEQIVMTESAPALKKSLAGLKRTLKAVWAKTKSEQTVSARFMEQLHGRLKDVYAVHHDFRSGSVVYNGLRAESFERLIEQARKVEESYPAPFSVYIHGDFNIDNILFDQAEKDIRFIDLHRSCQMDYVQDISVFMVSNYRLQGLDEPLRLRIRGVVTDFYQFARTQAKRADDTFFEVRLALGLARSFATSTRFILDRQQAAGMFMRSHYLLERVANLTPKSAKRFRVPVRELFNG